MRPDEAVGAHAQHRVAVTHAGAVQPRDPPHVGADVAGREQADQLGLGVRPQVPAPAQTRVSQHPPAQRTEHVLADHPRQQARAGAATA